MPTRSEIDALRIIDNKSVNPDGKRRILVLSRKDERWEIEVPDTVDTDHAKQLAEIFLDDNGGGWKLVKIQRKFSSEE